MKKSIISLAIVLATFSGFTTSCLSDGDDTIIVENGNPTDIPADTQATPNPEVNENNATIPNIQYTTVDENGVNVLRIDMTGIQDKSTLEWLRLLGTGERNQNVWVEVDGTPKGIKVYNTADNEDNASVPVDIVFLVDNSGSMSEEADAIARDITQWAEKLQTSGLDIMFGCVGYGGNVGSNNYGHLVDNYGVTGALNLTSAKILYEYFNRSGLNGTSRTKGYVGDDSAELSATARLDKYNKSGGECGVQALKFANEHFKFRANSNRVYVNFTDDYNYHGGNASISVNYISENWETSYGTIHTVFSGGFTPISKSYGDNPLLMSEYTGGTTIMADSSFSGVTLESLPVTDAMRNSYIIRFTNIDEFMDGQPHMVCITILSPDGRVSAERSFYIVFGTKE